MDDWPRYLSKKATNPHISLAVFIVGISLFHGGLIGVLMVIGLSVVPAVLWAVAISIGLILFALGGMELNYWATKYWNTHKEEED